MLFKRLRQAVPIPLNGPVAVDPKREDDVGEPVGVGVPEEERSITIDADSVYAISIPVSGYGNVSRQSVGE